MRNCFRIDGALDLVTLKMVHTLAVKLVTIEDGVDATVGSAQTMALTAQGCGNHAPATWRDGRGAVAARAASCHDTPRTSYNVVR